MKKILIISGSLPPIGCGVGYYTARLSREMAAEKMNLEILSTEGVDEDTAAPLLTVPDWKIRSLPKMLSAIDKSGAEIVHIEYPAVGYRRQLGVNLLPYVLRLFRHRLKIVITLHEYHHSRWIGRWRNRITIWPAHKIVVSNQPDAAALKRLESRISVIPIGANFDVAPRRPAFFEEIMRSHELSPKAKTLIFFGYAFPAKKLEVLLDALAEPQLKDFQLLIFPGLDDKSEYHRQLKARISKLNGSRPRVGVNDFLDGPDASAVLQECDFFVLPNSYPLSAKSGTAIAAVLNGLVLVSRGAEHADQTAPFVHLKNSYLLEEITPATIAQAIAELEASPDQVEKIRDGIKELRGYFSWENIAKEHLMLYEDL